MKLCDKKKKKKKKKKTGYVSEGRARGMSALSVGIHFALCRRARYDLLYVSFRENNTRACSAFWGLQNNISGVIIK
jgi:hypothetical protein